MSRNEVVGPRFEPVSLADEEEVKHVLVNSVLGLWDVVNNLTRLRPSRRDRYRVTIFGSARAKAGTFGYEETKRVSQEMDDLAKVSGERINEVQRRVAQPGAAADRPQTGGR